MGSVAGKKLSMSSQREYSMVQNNPLLSSNDSINLPGPMIPYYTNEHTTLERDRKLLKDVASSVELEILSNENNRYKNRA